jgi:hypothetical protein
MMNSLVFNVTILLWCSLAVSQFCSMAFAEFAKYTAANCKMIHSISFLSNNLYKCSYICNPNAELIRTKIWLHCFCVSIFVRHWLSDCIHHLQTSQKTKDSENEFQMVAK